MRCFSRNSLVCVMSVMLTKTNVLLSLFQIFLSSKLDEYLDMIIDNAKFNESLGEWQLKGIAFAGNNLRDQVIYFQVIFAVDNAIEKHLNLTLNLFYSLT